MCNVPKITVDVLLTGFPGSSNKMSLGISSVALARTTDHNILFDTAGFGSRGMLLHELETRNLVPGDVDMVLVSHLHFDHIANIDLFPHAQFVVSEEEWRYVHANYDLYVQMPLINTINLYRKRFLKPNEEVLPGLSSMSTPGHTPGGTTYIIENCVSAQGDCWGATAFAGDAIKNRTELRTGTVGMTYDKELSAQTIESVKKRCNTIIPGHDCVMKVVRDDAHESILPLKDNSFIVTFQPQLSANQGCQSISITLDS